MVYVPRFSSDGPQKSKVSHFKNLRFFNFRALGQTFVLALEPRVLKLEASSFGIRPYNAIVRQRKGTASLLNHLTKNVYKPAENMQENWRMEERAQSTKQTNNQWYIRCLDKNGIEMFHSISYSNNLMINENDIISQNTDG